MGCTSSAPNTLSANGKPSDNNMQIAENTIELAEKHLNIDERQSETKILPISRDFIKEVQVVRNNSSTLNINNLECENGKTIESQENFVNEFGSNILSEIAQDEKQEENISKLEVIVGKVFDMNQMLNANEQSDTNIDKSNVRTSPKHSVTEDKENESVTKNDLNEDATNDLNTKKQGEKDEESLEENPEEVSPTQSECSRSTRWEALADIVAELPPSLAIDPITGQIYTLTK